MSETHEPRSYTAITCPICSKYIARSFFLPKHLIKHHCEAIYLTPGIRFKHCISASVKTNDEKIDFYACFTCEKGFVGDCTTAHGSRWINSHEHKTECINSHLTAFTNFKQRQKEKRLALKIDLGLPEITHVDEQINHDDCVKPVLINTGTQTTEIIESEHEDEQNTNSQSITVKDGYVYCFANVSMPGILKIGMTTRIPNERLKEANSSNTWKPPTPYTILFAKKVKNPRDKETKIHELLSQFLERIHPNREFFRISTEYPNIVRQLFDLLDGEYWNEQNN